MTRPTMTDVARVAGVSKQTVSRIVNGKGGASAATTQRVLTAVDELGYRLNSVAQSLATRRTRTLGLVLSNLSNPYQSEIAEGAESAAWDLGYHLFMSNASRSKEKQESALASFEQKGVDGVIVFNPRQSDTQLIRLLRRHPAAVVLDRSVPIDVAGQISVDQHAAMAMAVRHLKALGRRTVGVLPGRGRTELGRALFKGFVDAIEANELRFDESLVVRGATTLSDATATATALLRRRPDVDAVVCVNDIVAIGVLQACRRLGIRVPDDVAVVGHGNITFAGLVTPSLTTLSVNRFEIGGNAVRMLVDRINGRNLSMEIVVKPELVVRESAPAAGDRA